ncbi:MAG: hypothetical protein ACETV0_05050 [Nitrososphaeria archaeon]
MGREAPARSLSQQHARDFFWGALVRSVTDTLGSLGEDVKQTVLLYMERDHGLTVSFLPINPLVLVQALRAIFGLGSMPLEQSIVSNLYRELELGPPAEEGFVQAVEAARYIYRHKNHASWTGQGSFGGGLA